ncbi:hypothetical protein ACOJQI_08345 [Bacillus salacetis]|uniref:hypothetical protein n=1 Tax=Bacillus salacetis TaxID=2315464 RepID=UPI003B9F6858
MKDLNIPGLDSFELREGRQQDFSKTTEELAEWVMDFLTADHFKVELWNEEVYFTIPRIKE